MFVQNETVHKIPLWIYLFGADINNISPNNDILNDQQFQYQPWWCNKFFQIKYMVWKLRDFKPFVLISNQLIEFVSFVAILDCKQFAYDCIKS